jgi:hypothetical protein
MAYRSLRPCIEQAWREALTGREPAKARRHARDGDDLLSLQSLPLHDHEMSLESASSNVVGALEFDRAG